MWSFKTGGPSWQRSLKTGFTVFKLYNYPVKFRTHPTCPKLGCKVVAKKIATDRYSNRMMDTVVCLGIAIVLWRKFHGRINLIYW